MQSSDPVDQIVGFALPPVVEVVLGVSFEQSDPSIGPALSAFWHEELREEFPSLQQVQPYTVPRERFTSEGSFGDIQIELTAAPSASRLWAFSADHQRLVQLQPGYFACNWRKSQADSEYDKWGARRFDFARLYSRLRKFLDDHGDPSPEVDHCEVTYVNHVRSGGTWQHHGEWAKIFTVAFGSQTPYPLERLISEAQFSVHAEQSQIARLHCKISPAYREGSLEPMYVLELTCRGPATGGAESDLLPLLDAYRRAIDETFVSVTTDQMHKEWGRFA